MPDIFHYHDFRLFLRDAYEVMKKKNPRFSYRYIAQKCHFSSSSFFKKVLDGTNALNMNTILVLAGLFRLNQKDKEYFEFLVLYSQAQTQQEKKYFLEKISVIKKIKVKIMDPFQLDFFNKWYNIAILELISFHPFKGDYKDLAARVEPEIKPIEAKHSIQLLHKLGLIRKLENGFYEKTHATLTTGYEALSTAIQHFQLETMDLAKQAIDRFNKEEREIATLTLSLSEDSIARIKDRMKLVRREILEMARLDEISERVYQVNMQIFPLSKKVDKEK